ncbi:hypothetical protein HDU87_007300 [Geranomyces variabilis]|uniref:Uncharacterized protein n=1 Tax=Geranomyces variabilis TaxID=109894 RepID=A0AAD5XPW7_9FUNG|nr:hypothetical protein HDU87_007300 [Geranomyces variabilis]
MSSPPAEPPSSRSKGLLQRAELLGTVLTQIFIVAICSVVLVLGISGQVLVTDDALFLREGYVGFAVGIAVQIALIAPLELCRTICKLWFWRRLVVRGENLRSLLCTWSVIYSNSYRGAEDLLQGIGPISGLLMLVYVIEVAILDFQLMPATSGHEGAIGSLYATEGVTTLKAQGEVPMLWPFQSITKDTGDIYADESVIPAEMSFFSFAKLYDPLTIQGIETNTTCEPASKQGDDNSHFSATWRGCGAVIASPLTTPPLVIAQTAAPLAVDWAKIVEGDILRSRAMEFFTTVECGPSDIAWPSHDGYTTYWINLNDTAGSTVGLWSAAATVMATPQVTIATLGTGDLNEDPVVDETGGMLFAVVAFNFDDLGNMTKYQIHRYDRVLGLLNETREIGVLLCRARVELGTVVAEYEMLQVSPGLVARLNYAVADTERVPYSMDSSTPYGYSMGIFLTETFFVLTCDYLPCPTDSKVPPLFDQTIGLVEAQPPAADGTVSYGLNFSTMTTNIAKLFSRNLLNYAAVPRYPEGIPANLLSTHAEIWELAHTKRIFTTAACNIILSIGIFCAVVLITLNLLQQTKGAMGGSVLQLLDAIGWRKMPNVTSEEWREAGVAKLRQHARKVMVRGALYGAGKVQLSLSSPKKLAKTHILSDSSLKLTHRTNSGLGGESEPSKSQRVARMDPGEV